MISFIGVRGFRENMLNYIKNMLNVTFVFQIREHESLF